MKIQLERQKKVNMICGCMPIFIGLCALISGEILAFIILLVIGVGLIVNEIIRSRAPKLTFDENGFCIGETAYSYTDIDRVDSNRYRYLVWVRIIVGGEVVYRFDNSYKNYKEFAKQLTLHDVEHDLFS